MYFGNTEGVLEYDGVSWRKIPVSNGSAVRALATDENGTVYVGAQGEFGYLRPDAQGALRYVSLLDRVPPDARKFTDVWSVLATAMPSISALTRVCTDGRPARTRCGSGSRPRGSGGSPWPIGPFTSLDEGPGLLRLRGEAWEPVPGGANFSNLDVRGVLAERADCAC